MIPIKNAAEIKKMREAGAEVFAITTSETQISCCIDAKSLSPAEEAVKKYYGIN